jgi:hypothetical protein
MVARVDDAEPVLDEDEAREPVAIRPAIDPVLEATLAAPAEPGNGRSAAVVESDAALPQDASLDETPAAPAPQPVADVLASQPDLELGAREIVACLLVLLLWTVLLTLGLTIGTPPFMATLQNPMAHSFGNVLGSAWIVVTCHTVPNMAMLCCLSAFLGVVASRAVGRADRTGPTPPERMGIYVAAITRGFFVFLVIASGALLLSDQTFTNLTPERYIRLAGLASLFSFSVGYNPRIFERLCKRIDEMAAGRADADAVRRPNS